MNSLPKIKLEPFRQVANRTAHRDRYASPAQINPLRHLLAVIASLVVAPFCCSLPASSTEAPPSHLPGEIAMDRPSRSEGAIIVRLRLEDGEEVPLKVDTGAPDTTLDESLAPKLGPRSGTRPASFVFNRRAGAEGVYRAPKLYAGDTQLLTGPRVYTMKGWPSGRHPEKGILGMDCLGHYCIQFDFVAGKMRFLEPDHLNTNDLGEAFAINPRAQGVAFVDADLFGQGKMSFLLDTGMSGPFDAMLAPKVFERLLHQYPTIGPDLYMTVPDGRAASGNIFPRVGLRGLTYTDLRLSSVDLHPRSVKGIIGMRFLARHEITLNFPRRTLYLKCISSAPLAIAPGASQLRFWIRPMMIDRAPNQPHAASPLTLARLHGCPARIHEMITDRPSLNHSWALLTHD